MGHARGFSIRAIGAAARASDHASRRVGRRFRTGSIGDLAGLENSALPNYGQAVTWWQRIGAFR